MYIPLHVHTHYSLLDGLSKPEQIAKRCKTIGAKSCAITDHGTISGNVNFYKTMKKNDIKPIMGCELYISPKDASVKDKTNSDLSHMVILCKNFNGWQDLISLVSLSNNANYFYYKPRLDLDLIHKTILDSHNLICITGHPGSTLADTIYSFDESKLLDDWKIKGLDHIKRLYSIFGEENVFVEIQLMDTDNVHQQTIGKALRDLCKEHKLKKTASIDAHYCESSDAVDQRVLLCSALKITLPEISNKIINNEKVPMSSFFTSEKYYILSYEEMLSIHDKEELDTTIVIDNMCESYEILSAPQLPTFECPDQQKPIEYLRHLCRQGWLEKIQNKIPKEQQDIYVDRVKKELSILESTNLASYFLIIRDIVLYIRNKSCLPGPGRGSAAGCLVSYLVGITAIDPIKYDLIFERFYNTGRNTDSNISMPDIDVDVPIEYREDIINYIKNKYGNDKVSQMITFNTLKGRGALKEVLRIYGNISFEEMNRITKHIPDEAKIADELQEMKDEDGEASILRWALENNGSKLKEWCYIGDDGQLYGPLAKRFEQAIRLEGAKYNQSKHAAGIAISNTSLNTICPMIWDPKTEQNIAGFEMSDLESIGVIKFDILGIALLDKIMCIRDILKIKKAEYAI
jgi:DNA polymerase-3 subunit alpha